MKVCVCGSRSITRLSVIEDGLSLLKINFTELVSGTCRGPDTLAESWAASKGVNIKRYPADWKKYGISAGPIRNKMMADYSDIVVAFWDGKSKGTSQMIDYCKNINRILFILNEEGKLDASTCD